MKNLITTQKRRFRLLYLIIASLFITSQLSAQYYTIVSPNGGEDWTANNTYEIKWTNSGSPDPVTLNYSTDGGDSWITIATNVACNMGSNSYYWSVPNTPSSMCIVQVSGIMGMDESDSYFTISSPMLLTISPSSVYWYDTPKGSILNQTFTITNPNTKPHTITNMRFDYIENGWFKKAKIKVTLNNSKPDQVLARQTFSVISNNAPVVVPPLSTLNVEISMHADSGGFFNYNFVCSTDSPNSDSALIATIMGTVLDGVLSKNKSSINFGTVSLGEGGKRDTLILTNIGTTPINLTRSAFKTPGGPFSKSTPNDSTNIDPNCSKIFYIDYNPDAAGNHNNVLELYNNSINDPNCEVPVSGTAVQPATIALNKNSINYGSSGYMTGTKDSNITIQNTSSETNLMITSFKYNSNDEPALFEILESPPIVIPTNSSYQITVRFHPVKVGDLKRILYIENTSQNNPNASVNLSATVLGSNISVTPQNINYGNMGISTAAKDTPIRISNTGPYKLTFKYKMPGDSSFSVVSGKPVALADYNEDIRFSRKGQIKLNDNEEITIEPGQSYDLVIRFSPNALGAKTDTLTIENNSSNSPIERVLLTRNIIPTNLSVDPSPCNFGTTSLGQPVINKKLTITNNSSAAITISNKTITGDTSSFKFTRNISNIILLPGQSDSVNINFSPRTSGSKNATLRINSNDPAGAVKVVELLGTGGGRPILYTSLSSINYSNVATGDFKDTSFIIRNDGNLDLVITSKDLTGTDKSYYSIIKGNSPVTLLKSQVDSIKIRVTGSLPIGNKTAQFRILSNDSANSPSIIGLSANITAPIIKRPFSFIQIDSTPVGTTRDTTIFIKNIGNANLKINNISFDGPASAEFASEGLPGGSIILPNEEKPLTIKFTPAYAGNRDTRILITSNDPENPEISIMIRGLGQGISKPTILVPVTTLNYGYIDPNNYSDIPLLIKNIGGVILKIDSFSIGGASSGSFAIINRSFPFNINPLDSAKVTIRYYSVSGISNPTAQLRIISNDPDNPSVSVNLIAVTQKPVITVDSSIDFGKINVLDSTTKNLIISNNSAVFFVIDTIIINSGQNVPFSFNSIKFPIKVSPGDSYTLPIKYKPLSYRSYSSSLKIISSTAANSPVIVKLIGDTRKPSISISLYSIDFGSVELNNSKDTSLAISNTGDITLRIDSLTLSGPNAGLFSIIGTSLPLDIEPGLSKNIIIRFSPGNNSSLLFAGLNITSNDLNKPNLSISLSGSGGSPSIVASDTLIDFGKVVISDTGQKSLRIDNRSFIPLRIDSLYITNDPDNAFSFDRITLPYTVGSTGNISINFKFNPRTAKTHNAFLNIISNDKSKNPLKIRLTGNVITPALSVSNTLSFGKIKIDFSKTVNLKLGNLGEGYLKITGIVLNGPDSSEFKIQSKVFPFKIEQGKSDSISVQFNPKTIGKKNAKILISGNDLNSPVTVILDAEGILQNLAYNPASLNFGDVTYSDPKQDSITLQNQGAENITVNSLQLTGLNTASFSFINLNPSNPFILSPNATKTIIIQFDPDSLGIRNANIEVNSNDPLAPKIVIPIFGNCLTPSIVLGASQINFSNVRIDYTKDTTLIIRNNGNGKLFLFSTSLSGENTSEFKIIGLTGNREILPGKTDTLKLRFAPKNTGDKWTDLHLTTNDYNKETSAVRLLGKGIQPKLTSSLPSINFGKIFVIKTYDTLLTITNSGSDNLLIKNLRISGTDSAKFAVKSLAYPALRNIILAPGAGLSLQVSFYPQIIGNKSAILLIESDDASMPVTSIPLSGEGFIPSIILNTDLIATENTDKQIIFRLDDNYPPNLVKVFYRRGGSLLYDSVSIDVPGSWIGSIPFTYTFDKSLITRNGLDFYIRISWTGANSFLPKTNSSTNPLSLQIKIAKLNSDIQLVTKNYSMATIPLQFQGTSLLAEMVRNLGDVNSSSWRIFRWRNNNYEEFLDEIAWQINPGDGFWMVINNNKTLDFQNCVTIPTSTPFAIRLQPGWNQIGSPFLYQIPFANLIIPIGKNVERILWDWNFEGGYREETSFLNPWVGYFIKNNESDSVDILIAPAASAIANTNLFSTSNTQYTANEWKTKLEVTFGKKVSKIAEIGRLCSSLDNWDMNDISSPPEMNAKYISVRFPHNDWKVYKGNYVRDYKSTIGFGKTWDLEIQNTSEFKEGEIKFLTEGNFPSNYQITLYDYDVDRSFNIFNNYKLNFEKNQTLKKIRLTIGTKEFIEENKTFNNNPENFALFQNYPNPFNPSTVINYQIPENCFVSLKIFDLTGKEIATLVSGNKAAGIYNIRWDAKGIPSGIYYYKLSAGSFTDTKKLILLK